MAQESRASRILTPPSRVRLMLTGARDLAQGEGQFCIVGKAAGRCPLSDPRAIKAFEACETCNVHHLGLCSSLAEESIAALGRLARTRRVGAGTVLAREGSQSREVYNVISGVVRLSKLLPDGREQIVGLLQPSDFLGCVFDECCAFTATVVRDAELCCFDRPAFEALLRQNHEIEHAFLQEVLTELHAARDWMVVLGSKSGRERVASFLMLLIQRAERHGCRKSLRGARPVYELPLTRVDIGHFLGLSLETVSRQISGLVADGVIELIAPRLFRVCDSERLRSLSANGPVAAE